MPSSQVQGKWERGELHSGSKTGPKVPHTRAGAMQMYAIQKSEERAEAKHGGRYPERKRKGKKKMHRGKYAKYARRH